MLSVFFCFCSHVFQEIYGFKKTTPVAFAMAEHRISNDIPIYPWVAWRSHIRCAPWWSYAKDRQWIATGATSWMAEAIHVYRGNCGCKTVLKW